MLSVSNCKCFCASSASMQARIARAAWRPSVECSAAGVARTSPIAATFSMRQVGVLAGQRMPLRVADQNLRQRPHLHRFAVEARRFHPGIFLVRLPSGELRARFLPPMDAAAFRPDNKRASHLRLRHCGRWGRTLSGTFARRRDHRRECSHPADRYEEPWLSSGRSGTAR